MSENKGLGMLVDESTTLTFIEVCHRYSISEQLLSELIEQGLFPHLPSNERTFLDQSELRRMESAFRLHKDLGINLEGVALALDLLDRIEFMERELSILRKLSLM